MSKRVVLVSGFLALGALLLGNHLRVSSQAITSEEFITSIKEGERRTAKRYLYRGGDANSADLYGDTALIWACFRKDTTLASQLLDHGADPNMPGSNQKTPLHWTSEDGSFKLSQILLEAGAAVNQKDKWGRTPLMYAVQSHNMNMVKLLLEQGAEANLSDRFDKCALLLAVDYGDPGMVELLVTRGAQMDNPCKEGITPLRLAVERKAEHLFLSEKIRSIYPNIQNRMLAYR